MNVSNLSSFSPRPVAIEPRPPVEKTSMEEMQAAYRAEHPLLTPQQALASGAELGPPTDDPRADNHGSKIHTEIKVNGKVIARAYNGGGIEIASEYGFLREVLGAENDKGIGPDLAANRVARIKAALESYGALPKDDLGPEEVMTATLAKKPILETLLADTVQTQQEWLDDMAKQGRLDPGALFSRVA
jgi:hypothetical protein